MPTPPPPTAATADADAPAPPRGADPGTWSLHVAYAEGHDPQVLARLVDEYLPYATALARRWHRGPHPLDDLRQVACEGLVLALQRFDPRRGLPFFALARPTIEGSLKRYYRDHGWSVRVPRRVHELAIRRRDAQQRLPGSLRRAPSDAEVAKELRVSEPVLLEAMAAERARATVSTAAIAPDGETYLVADDLELADAAAERIDLARALDRLGPDERAMVWRYYFAGHTQSAIAADLGVSQMQVSRLLLSVIRRLRSHLAEAAA